MHHARGHVRHERRRARPTGNRSTQSVVPQRRQRTSSASTLDRSLPPRRRQASASGCRRPIAESVPRPPRPWLRRRLVDFGGAARSESKSEMKISRGKKLCIRSCLPHVDGLAFVSRRSPPGTSSRLSPCQRASRSDVAYLHDMRRRCATRAGRAGPIRTCRRSVSAA